MPWARFEDDYLGNQKLATLSTVAIALDMAAIIYSARELRDGQLTVGDVEAIAALLHVRKWQPAAVELVKVNRWARTERGYAIHDYLEYQPSREQIMQDRAKARERKRHAARGRWDSGRNPHEPNPDSWRLPDAPVPGPGPGPGPERSHERSGGVPPKPPVGIPDEFRANSGRTMTACCPFAEVTSGAQHSDFCVPA